MLSVWRGFRLGDCLKQPPELQILPVFRFRVARWVFLSCNKLKPVHGAIRRFYSGTKRREVQGMMDAICIFAGVIVGTLIARKIDKKRKK